MKKTKKMDSEVKDDPKFCKDNKTHLRLNAKRRRRKCIFKNSSLRNIKPKNLQLVDRPGDIEDQLLQFKIELTSLSSTRVCSTSVDYGCEFVEKLPQLRSNLPPPLKLDLSLPFKLNPLPLKREENLRTYSRRLKNDKAIDKVLETSKVIFSNEKCTASDRTTNVGYAPGYVDSNQEEIMQCNNIAVKLENDESDDAKSVADSAVVENMKIEIVCEEYNENEYNCWAATNENSIDKNVPSLQDEIRKKAEEIIEHSCNRKHDDDTLNFVKGQLLRALEVLKSTKECTSDLIS